MFNLGLSSFVIQITGIIVKMSTDQPVIKFSPFQALLIGEKNKILKRQPMKNTIFVTRLNQQPKAINLRDLFGLEKENSKSQNSDVIFKIPQRVREFFRIRKLKNKSSHLNKNNNDVLTYEFEGQKILVEHKDSLRLKNKVSLKSNKVKFKRKYKHKKNITAKVAKKFPTHNNSRINYYKTKSKNSLPKLVSNDAKKKKVRNVYKLRSNKRKNTSKDYNNLKLSEISTKNKHLTNYVHNYLKAKKEFYNQTNLLKNNLTSSYNLKYALRPSRSLKNSCSCCKLTKDCFNDSFKNFHFPKFLTQSEQADFEDDSNLINLIYEHFPKNFKFESSDLFEDFSCTLMHSGIIKPEKIVKSYEKKIRIVKKQEVRVLFDDRIPCIELKKLSTFNSNHCPFKKLRYSYENIIDEPYNTNSQLISHKTIGNVFFKSVEGKDVFVGSLVKPYFHNSWFGSLPEL